MNIILIEDPSVPIVSSEIKEKFPQPSIRYVNKKTDSADLVCLKNHPLLTIKWLVIIEHGSPIDMIEGLVKLETCVCVVMSSKSNYLSYISLCKKFGECRFIDASKLDKASNRKYVIKRIGVGEKCADKLCVYCNEYLPYIEEAIITLQSLDKDIVEADISKYISKRTGITVHSLFYHLIGYKTCNDKLMTLFLYRFRYALPYLKKKLVSLLDTTMKLYSSMQCGELGPDDIDSYMASNEKLGVSKYFVSNAVTNLYSSIDYDVLVLTKIKIEKTENIIQLLSYL